MKNAGIEDLYQEIAMIAADAVVATEECEFPYTRLGLDLPEYNRLIDLLIGVGVLSDSWR